MRRSQPGEDPVPLFALDPECLSAEGWPDSLILLATPHLKHLRRIRCPPWFFAACKPREMSPRGWNIYIRFVLAHADDLHIVYLSFAPLHMLFSLPPVLDPSLLLSWRWSVRAALRGSQQAKELISHSTNLFPCVTVISVHSVSRMHLCLASYTAETAETKRGDVLIARLPTFYMWWISTRFRSVKRHGLISISPTVRGMFTHESDFVQCHHYLSLGPLQVHDGRRSRAETAAHVA